LESSAREVARPCMSCGVRHRTITVVWTSKATSQRPNLVRFNDNLLILSAMIAASGLTWEILHNSSRSWNVTDTVSRSWCVGSSVLHPVRSALESKGTERSGQPPILVVRFGFWLVRYSRRPCTTAEICSKTAWPAGLWRRLRRRC